MSNRFVLKSYKIEKYKNIKNNMHNVYKVYDVTILIAIAKDKVPEIFTLTKKRMH